MRTVILANSETKIEKKRLAELERKERAHDAYLRATHKMAEAKEIIGATGSEGFASGWRACLRTFAELIVREDG